MYLIDQRVVFQQGSRLYYLSVALGHGDAVGSSSSAEELDDNNF